MALFDFFRSRRQRESAIPASFPGDSGAAAPSTNPPAPGNVEVVQGPTEVMNLQDHSEELRADMLETLKQHGIDAHRGEAIQVTDPSVQQAIFATLAQHGVNVNAATAGQGVTLGAFGAGAGRSADGGADPVDQIARLAKLREEGSLTDSEFEQEKRKLLDG